MIRAIFILWALLALLVAPAFAQDTGRSGAEGGSAPLSALSRELRVTPRAAHPKPFYKESSHVRHREAHPRAPRQL